MPYPTKLSELDDFLLLLIAKSNGSVRRKDCLEPLANLFSLTSAERKERMCLYGHKRWENTVDWARKRLANARLLERPGADPGIWRITELGQKRAERVAEDLSERSLALFHVSTSTIKFEKCLDISLTELYVFGMPVTITIRNMPEDLHRKMKERAAKEGMSLSAYLLRIVRHSAEVPTIEEMRERLARLTPVVTSESPADIIREHRGPI